MSDHRPTNEPGKSDNRRNLEADLAMVRGLMTESSRAIHDSGWHHLLWGGVIAAATVCAQGFTAGWFPIHPALTWGIAVAIGWVLSVAAGLAIDRRQAVTTGAGSVTQRVWIAVGISLTILGFIGIPNGAVTPRAVSIVTATLLAGAYFASSVGPRLNWFMGLAIAWWVGAAVLVLLPPEVTELAFAGMMLVIEVGVGLVLVARNRGRGPVSVQQAA